MRKTPLQPLTLLLALITFATAIWLATSTPPEKPAVVASPPLITQTELAPKPIASPAPQGVPGQRLVFDIAAHSPNELRTLLTQAETLIDGPQKPVAHLVLVLHGEDVRYFAQSQYQTYKDIVDLAAKLDAYNVIDMKMCRTAMAQQGIEDGEIPSFIELVPFGPAEVQRLTEADYLPM